QVNFRGSILYNSILGNTNHTFVTGLTFVYDDYQESLDSASFNRTERVPGAFFEYTWNNIERFTLVAGGRLDYHNQYGLFYTPRLHMRYSLNEMNSIKVSAGKGYRLANVIMENVGRLASNREFVILSSDEFGFGVKPEESWSFGANFVSKFRLNYRDASFSADFYSTQFVNQTVIDLDADAQTVLVYNLQGKSWSNSAQAEFVWTPRRRVDVRMAYRWLDVQTDYIQERRFAPFVSKHRGFITASYKTKSKGKGAHWRFDGTLQWIGKQRIPYTDANPPESRVASTADDFFQLNAQVTKAFTKDFELYLGVENATDFRQSNPILSAENPFDENFDASMIWGPVFGRMFFGGLRYTIQ
ncbi:MAG: TonB-dependent receptor plug domain-containing protein, partial [Flavobacteriales bacterium]